ncbi:MAG: MATE family efflux transporter [Oscillospiraceae bacterium]|nr:MATE family efflux transporter [Oscillospiraceae bacterium]
MAGSKDLTVGEPSQVLRRFCLPLFGSIIFQQFYNLADSFVAGKYIGQDALAAVGNSYEITLIFIAFAFGSGIGTSVVTARLFGAKQYARMKTAVTTALIAIGTATAVLMLLGLPLNRPLLRLIHTPDNIFPDSAAYMTVYILSLPFVFFYNAATGIFSALGDSKTPFRFLAASSTANVAMDILFVRYFQMGVPGTAWATLICQGVSCVLSLFFLHRRLRTFRTAQKAPLFSVHLLNQIAVIAIPSILQQSFISVGNIIIQRVINDFGSATVAGYSAAVKLNNLVITSLTTIGNGVSNFTAQNLGANKKERVPEGHKAACKMVWCIMIPFMVLYFFAGAPLVQFFLKEPGAEAVGTGVLFLRIVSPFYLIAALKLVSDGVLRGAGMMLQFMTATFTDLVLRVVLAWVLSVPFGSPGIWTAWPIGWCVATVISVTAYIRSFRRGQQDTVVHT